MLSVTSSGCASCANTNGGTFVWNPTVGDEVVASGDGKSTEANCSVTGITLVLKCTNTGISIPLNSVIRGIEANIYRKEFAAGDDVVDNLVKIVKNDSIVGNDLSSGVEWPTSYAYQTYGGPSELWGVTWTAADINSSTFGVAIQANHQSAGAGHPNIDHVYIKVYYDLPGDFGLGI